MVWHEEKSVVSSQDSGSSTSPMIPSPVVSQSVSPSIAPVQSSSSLLVAGDEAISGVDNEHRPIGVCSLEQSTSLGVGINSRSRKCSDMSTSGRWSAAEHKAFLRGLKVYGREWKKVATLIPNRTSAQIRSHAQKYFAKASKVHEHFLASTEHHLPSSDDSVALFDPLVPEFYAERVESIMMNPHEVETEVYKTLASLRERCSLLEDRLHQVDDASSYKPPSELVDAMIAAQTVDAVIGPATAALESEQQHLRAAAKARYEMKRKTPPITVSNNTESKRNISHFVSLASMPSTLGGFDSSDVIALSMLSGTFGREGQDRKLCNQYDKRRNTA